jgi:5-methylcytosine-specific restriction endonuclease McrA
MANKICKICKQEFVSFDNRFKCCSAKCSIKNKKDISAKWKKDNPYLYRIKTRNLNKLNRELRNETFLKEKETQRKWRENNKDKYRALIKKYKSTPKGKLACSKALAKRRDKKVKHNFSTREWVQKLDKTQGVCPSCGKDVGLDKMTLDHIIPIAKAPPGLRYTIDMVQPLCKRCNSSKQDKLNKEALHILTKLNGGQQS